MSILATPVGCSGSGERPDTTATSAPSSVSTATAGCLGVDSSGTLRVGADSIGALPTLTTFGELRARCPGSRDTTVEATDHQGAALAIPAPPGSTVLAVAAGPIAVSFKDRPMAMASRQPGFWRVHGSAIELPGGVRGTARWGELIRRYGPALVYGGKSRARAMFCHMTDFRFTFDVPAVDTTRSFVVDSSSSQVPRESRVTDISIMPGQPQPAAKECGGTGPSLEPSGPEHKAIVTSNGTVRRVGDTLFIRATNGKQSTFVTRPENNDMKVAYTYVGTIANGTLHQIHVQGWETWWTSYIQVATGQRFNTAGEPLISPDGRRIASSSYALEVCEIVARLEIYRLTDSLPALEFEIEPRDCIAETGWSPRDLEWLSPDTLAFIADRSATGSPPSPLDTNRSVSGPTLAIRDRDKWRIVPRR